MSDEPAWGAAIRDIVAKSHASLFHGSRPNKYQEPMRACFCIGPQRGDPVCPCLMRDRVQHDLGLWVDEVKRQTKRRVRVKAPSRVVP